MSELHTIETLDRQPFKFMVATIGNLPTSFVDSMSYYELLAWLCQYLEKTVIPAIDNNAEAVEELQAKYIELKAYVDNYFENLDVQEEINNKLDDMAESGQLTELITAYLNIKSQLCFNSVEEMKASENLVDGTFAKTYGHDAYNDGGGALYKVRAVSNQDVEDDMFIIAVDDPTLVAELIIEDNILNIKQIGAKGDGETDNAAIFQAAIDREGINNIYVPEGVFLCSTQLTPKDGLTIKGEETSKYNTTPASKIKFSASGFVGAYSFRVENMNIEGSWVDATSPVSRGFYNSRLELLNSSISKFTAAIDTMHVSTVMNAKIYHNKLGINGMIDSSITNSYIYDNLESGINLFQGSNDNTISNNKIEWNGEHGVGCYRGYNNVISNNIIDRNGKYGVLLNDCSANTVVGNILRRNYASADSVGDTYAHIRIENTTGAIISGNYTAKGAKNDDGTGTVVPSTALYLTTSSNTQLIGNDLSGGNNKQLATYNTGTYYRLDNVKTPAQLFQDNYIKTVSGAGVVSANGGNRSFTFEQTAPDGLYALPTFREVIIQYRRTDNSVWGAAKFILAIKQTSSAPAYSVSVKNEMDGASTILTNLSASATFDGTNITLTITNSTTNEFGVSVNTIA